MKKALILAGICLAYLGAEAQLQKENLQSPFQEQSGRTKPGFATEYKHIRLYYIKAKPTLYKAFEGMGKYTSLEQAISQSKIVVTEVSNAGTVNTLRFTNQSKDSIIVGMGDIVKGGKQDRVVEKDTLIAPGKTVQIPVYCVEQGRWSAQGGSTQFSPYHSKADNSLRKTIVKEKNQQRVWSKVAEINQAYGTSPTTGTYTAVSQSDKYKTELASYKQSLMQAMQREKDLVGIVAVTGDKIIGCDIYATPALFRDHAANLVHSYASEALKDGKPVSISDQKVQQYLNQLLAGELEQDQQLQQNGRSLKVNGKKVKITAFAD
ncbi:MAG TPA: hypothetical protein DCQ34_01785 [Chitinophagaceae bacterium]|nr:hypothetical protein [Chitinophagaceae bacterium]